MASALSTRHRQAYVRTVDPCEGLVWLPVHHGVRSAHDEGGELLGGGVYVQTRLVGARRRHHLKLRIYLILGIGPLSPSLFVERNLKICFNKLHPPGEWHFLHCLDQSPNNRLPIPLTHSSHSQTSLILTAESLAVAKTPF